jgi:phosphoglycolate phosphatase
MVHRYVHGVNRRTPRTQPDRSLARGLARLTHALIDLDGTITDSFPAITGSLKLALADLGLPIPADEALRAVVGPPFELGLPLVGVTGDQVWAVIDRYRVHYEAGGLFECELYDGVVDMLDELLAAGITLGLATAKPEDTAVRIIEHFGLTDRFAVLAGATYEPGRRTKDEVITHALRMLGIDPGPHVVMVGDRDHDVHGAAVHGIASIGVLWGYGDRAELTRSGATALAATPRDVVALVTGSDVPMTLPRL